MIEHFWIATTFDYSSWHWNNFFSVKMQNVLISLSYVEVVPYTLQGWYYVDVFYAFYFLCKKILYVFYHKLSDVFDIVFFFIISSLCAACIITCSLHVTANKTVGTTNIVLIQYFRHWYIAPLNKIICMLHSSFATIHTYLLSLSEVCVGMTDKS